MSNAIRHFTQPPRKRRKGGRPVNPNATRPIVCRAAHKLASDDEAQRRHNRNVGQPQHAKESVKAKRIRRELRAKHKEQCDE